MPVTPTTPDWHADPGSQGLRGLDDEGRTAQVGPPSQSGPTPVVGYADPAGTPWTPAPWANADRANESRTIQPYATWTQPGSIYPPGEKVLDDGAILASRWQRLLASMLDTVIVIVLMALVWIPWYGTVLSEELAGSTGDPASSPTMILLTLLSLMVRLVYNIGFLIWKQSTPGKMALGIKVRRVGEPRLTVGDVLKRQSFEVAATFLSLVSGSAAVITAVDAAWLLWDPKRQTLHDKIAGTTVVLRATTRPAPRDLR